MEGCCKEQSQTLTMEEDRPKDIDDDQHLNERDTWGNTVDFLLACIGSSVGLGNVWRFPYLCYKNGGGAFLIPYFLSVVIGGFPIMYLEIALGQYMSQGGFQAWKIVPLFQGVGLATIIINFVVNVYYNVILAWSFYYMFSSFTDELPWEKCGHEWNSINCSDNYNMTFKANHTAIDPVTEFWEKKVLGVTGGLDEPGILKWDTTLCLLLAWVVVYACIWKGIKSSGKVMYVTATAPYIFMLILLVRNCTLDGSSDGIDFYLKANMTKLTELTVWVDATTQTCYSWGIGLGVLTVMGSYNKFKHDSCRDAVVFSVVNTCTSFLAGFIVFTILGFMAKQANVSVADVAESGPGLGFIAYPKAVAQLPLSPLWSIMFFFMLIVLGLDSEFVGVEATVSVIVDQFPQLLRKGYRKEFLTVVVCLVMFILGLPMVTEGGIYVFELLDYYSASRIILVVTLSELIAVCHVYGVRRFGDNVRMMVGETKLLTYVLPYLQFCWVFLAPAFSIATFVMSLINYSELTYNRPNHPTYHYPDWGVAIGWSIAAFAIIWVPIIAVYRVVKLLCMGGSLTRGDFKLLMVPYFLSEQQKRPQDRGERCLAQFEGNLINPDRSIPMNFIHGRKEHSSCIDASKPML